MPRRSYRSRSRRTRGRERNRRPSVSIANVNFNQNTQFTAGSTTVVHENKIAAVPVNTSTINRKIGRTYGEIDLSIRLGAGHTCEAIFMFLVWPEERELPTIAEWDPFASSDNPGNPSYQGGVAAPFGIRRFAFGLPTGGSTTTLGEPKRYVTRGNRLIRPGHSLRAVIYAKASTSTTVSFTGQFGMKIYG